jgi:dihydroflavonol-4-reductase
MKVAVTGASGHVGANLCRMLIEKGHEVRALVHHDDRAMAGIELELFHGDVTNERDLEELCTDREVLFHLAAFISIRRKNKLCKKINVESCNKLIEAAEKKGVRRIIHFSSIHAFCQQPSETELNENRELALNSKVDYDHSKAWSQLNMLRSSKKDLEIIVLNPTAIIGPYDFKPSLLGSAIIRFYIGSIPGLVGGGYNWVDVRDVCVAAINAIEMAKPGECYLLGGSWQSLKALAQEIEKLGGHKTPRIEYPLWLSQIGAPFMNLHAALTSTPPLYTSVSLETLKNSHRNISSEKARTQLGYQPRPFSVTLSDTIEWFRANYYL